MLKEASRTWEDITRILLVGGSTRMPMVIEALEAESGVVINRSISPDEAVAHGAAVYADFVLASQNDEETDLLVRNVNSHDLGVLAVEASTGMPRRKILIPKNSSLPAKGSGNFKTRDKNQQTVAVNVIEGGDASGRNSTKIGACVVSDLPENLPAKTAVAVEFKYLENGRLNVSATIPGTDVQATLEIERAAGLSDEKIEYWGNWIADGAILTPIANTVEETQQQAAAESDQEIDFDDVEESSPFEALEETDSEPEAAAEGFDFGALSEESSNDSDNENIEADGFFAADEENASSAGGFSGLVTDEEESQGDVGTDDSDLAGFLNDLE